MTDLALYLSVAMPPPTDTETWSLLILATMITLVVAAIRWMARRTRIIMVVSGTSVLVVILTVLVLAYLTLAV
ncbi:hypothetical protein [Nonomuraea turcica]|uniref:hypothetical protein n=1 Tax=Nonomuraea sp. G32 TaxID=3067274 RepID=UPI00273C1F1F|nr:hypothetical protein [Nonomuraea sp. G32]MDP4504697.1 hypothetical protein [Nonomuraea sp. G32]